MMARSWTSWVINISRGLVLAWRGVFDKPLAVPDQAAKVELIVEDSCAARS
jgi:hypothetical protein